MRNHLLFSLLMVLMGAFPALASDKTVEISLESGLVLPVAGKAVWKLKSGDFCYIELELVDIEYNTAEEY